MSGAPQTTDKMRAYRRAAMGGAITGAVVAVALCFYVAASVEYRGCNLFLDHSDIGVPLCR